MTKFPLSNGRDQVPAHRLCFLCQPSLHCRQFFAASSELEFFVKLGNHLSRKLKVIPRWPSRRPAVEQQSVAENRVIVPPVRFGEREKQKSLRSRTEESLAQRAVQDQTVPPPSVVDRFLKVRGRAKLPQ